MVWETERDQLLQYRAPDDTDHAQETRTNEPASTYGKVRKPFDIVERTRLFALDIIDFSKVLYDSGWRSLGNQILRSGTSIGANMSESQQAESKDDFIHKVRMAAKEAKESRYWQSLCRDSPHLPYQEGMWEESDQLTAILSTILAKTLGNHPRRKR